MVGGGGGLLLGKERDFRLSDRLQKSRKKEKKVWISYGTYFLFNEATTFYKEKKYMFNDGFCVWGIYPSYLPPIEP